MARKTKEEAQQTRCRILDSAIKVFSAKGVPETSLEDIAKEAQVTRGAIYWHFKDKKDIFEALHDTLHQPLCEMIMQDMEIDHPEPLQQLEDLCIKLFLDLEDDPVKEQLLRLFVLRTCDSHNLTECVMRYQEKQQEKLALFAQYFEKAKKKGRLPQDANPEILALSITCYLQGILMDYFKQPMYFDLKTKVPLLISAFFKGYQCSDGK